MSRNSSVHSHHSREDEETSPPPIHQYDIVEDEIEVLEDEEHRTPTPVQRTTVKHGEVVMTKSTEAPTLPLPAHPSVGGGVHVIEVNRTESMAERGVDIERTKSGGSGGGGRKRSTKTDKRSGPASEAMTFDLNGDAANEIFGTEVDIAHRDRNENAKFLDANFFDVFAEPNPHYHSIACVWTLSFRIFEVTRIYVYKILTLLFGIIISFLAGFFFAFFAFVNIWMVRPALHLARLALYQILFIWPTWIVYVIRPCFYATGAVFSSVRIHQSTGPVIKEIWEDHVHVV